jgi:Flp pilus assembly CpaE family ATPase
LFERVCGKDHDRLRLVVNRYHPDDVISLDDVHRTVGLEVYWTLSNDYEAVSRAINSGNPVARNAKSRYARDLQALGADLVGVTASTNGGGRTSSVRKIGDLLGRLRRQPEKVAS